MAVASTPLVAAPSCPAWAKRRRGRQPQFDGKPCEPAEEEDMWLCLADGRARSTADLKRLATRGETRRRWRRRRRQRHARADGFGRGGAATAWAAAAPSATSTPSAQLERGQAQGSVAACGARLSVSGGGRHVARREDDKCASLGSLFIGQSSGTQVETEHGRRKAGGAGAGGR